MKSKLSVIGVVLIAILFLSVVNNKYLRKSGTIGDVKYSIIPPEEFEKANGCGWQLLDGAVLNESTDLYEFISMNGLSNDLLQAQTKLPDARGLFLRGMQQGRDDEKGDVNNRKVGDFQQDEVKAHFHGMNFPKGPGLVADCGDCAGVYHTTPVESNTGWTGGRESRPQNISLYIYIKVNNNCN